MRLAGENPRVQTRSCNANEFDTISKKFILQSQSLQVFQRKGRLQSRSVEIERYDVARSGRFGKLEPEGAVFDESQIVLTTAFFQRLETFEEAFRFFCPIDEPSETFVVN